MKTFAIAALTAGFATTALASGPVAPIPYVPPVIAPITYDWSGAYVGVGLAYTSARSSSSFAGVSLPTATGASLGVLAGYNWQRGNTVMGVEAALNFSDISGSNTCGLGLPLGCTVRINNFAALRARLGVAMDRTLLFVTAGYATDERAYTFSPPVITDNVRFNGPVIGVGVEHALSNSWTVRGDLEHYFFGSEPTTIPLIGTVSASTSLLRFSIVRRF